MDEKLKYAKHEQVLDALRVAGSTALADDLDFYVAHRVLWRNEEPEIHVLTQEDADRALAFPGKRSVDELLLLAGHTDWDIRVDALEQPNFPDSRLVLHAERDRNGNVRAHATDEILRRAAELTPDELSKLDDWDNNRLPCPVKRIEDAIQLGDFDIVVKMGPSAVRRFVYWVWPESRNPLEAHYKKTYTSYHHH